MDPFIKDTPQFHVARHNVLLHQKNLHQTLMSAIDAVQSGSSNPKDLEVRLRALQAAAEGVSECLTSIVAPKYYNEFNPKGSTIAVQAFQIPELLELILLKLPAQDIVRLETTCRFIKDAVSKSNKVQRRIGLLPLSQGNTTFFPFHRGPQFFAYWNDLHLPRPSRIHARFRTSSAKGMPHVGSRWHRTLLCQPPIKTMRVEISCCESVPTQRETVSSETGITIGNLYDAARKVLDRHAACKENGARMSDRSDRDVSFLWQAADENA